MRQYLMVPVVLWHYDFIGKVLITTAHRIALSAARCDVDLLWWC